VRGTDTEIERDTRACTHTGATKNSSKQHQKTEKKEATTPKKRKKQQQQIKKSRYTQLQIKNQEKYHTQQ